jgi:hypothetical protein
MAIMIGDKDGGNCVWKSRETCIIIDPSQPYKKSKIFFHDLRDLLLQAENSGEKEKEKEVEDPPVSVVEAMARMTPTERKEALAQIKEAHPEDFAAVARPEGLNRNLRVPATLKIDHP